MGVIVSHPTGNEFSKAVIKGLQQRKLLQSYYTTVANIPGSFINKLGYIPGFTDLKRRSLDMSLNKYVHTHGWKELGRQAAIKTGIKSLTKHETGFFSVDAVYTNLDNYIAQRLRLEKTKGADAVYAYEDGAYHSFKKAKELGIRCIYDLPIGYWRSLHNIFIKEKTLNPEWAAMFEGLNDSPKKLQRKDEELKLADTIIVASSFTLNTLNEYSGSLSKIYVVPYAFPEVATRSYESFKTRRKIKLLFVGGLTQRKGLSYLFKAVDGMEDHVSLTVVGRRNKTSFRELNDNLKKHTWIPGLSHAEILKTMHNHDVLLFPSLFEGFGLVITEAMAQGTPVITTERTAGPDVIRHNENGWIIKAGSAEALREAIEKLVFQPGLIEAAGRQASKTAATRTWKMYGKEIAEIITDNN